jgi:radical SAM-linked protein
MRVRFRFTKVGKVRFVGHRDVARLWERAIRRAGLPVALTEGFSPRAKVHFGLALPTAYESWGEYLDVDLREPECLGLAVDELPARLTPMLPIGLDVEAAVVVDPRAPSLQQSVVASGWRIEVIDLDPTRVATQVERLLAADQIEVTRQRKGKDVTDDIRPYIASLDVIGSIPDDRVLPGTLLAAELGTQPRGLRPNELLAAFEPAAAEGLVIRTHQWVSTDGARHEPLEALVATGHAEARAS